MTHAAIQSLATLSLACTVILAIFSRLMELKVVQAHILKSTSICLYTSITEGFLEVMAEREMGVNVERDCGFICVVGVD